jgi:hypothetical protein
VDVLCNVHRFGEYDGRQVPSFATCKGAARAKP